MTPRVRILFLLALVLAGVGLASPVHAQSLQLPDVGNLIPSQFQNLNTAFASVWNVVVGVSGIAFLGLLLYGGFLYLTSAGHEPQVERAKHTMRDALIGIVLVILAWPLGILVLNFFGQGRLVRGGSTSGLQVPTATSGTPLNPTSGSSSGTVPSGTTAPGGTTVPSGTQPPASTAVQTPITSSNGKPNSTFFVHQPGQPTQTVAVGANGQVSYTLDPSETYNATTLVFVSSQNTNNTVSNVAVNIYRQLESGDQLMFASVQPNANGQITLSLPIGEKVKIINAGTNAELTRDQEIRAGMNELRVTVPQ